MSKGTLVVVAAILALCSVSSGQQAGPDAFNLEKFRRSEFKGGVSLALAPNFFALDNPVLFPALPVSPLLNRGFLSFSTALDWLTPVDALPAKNVGTRQSEAPPPNSDRSLPGRLGELLPNVDYATAEIGFMYGRFTGKSGGDYKLGYILGEVGDDKVHISVGAAYEDSNLPFPRLAR